MLAAGGKRLRPRITLLAAAACGGEPLEHLHLAAYMELIHVATLVHDDVVDNARTRRGVNATAVDYGNRVSVLAGDYLFAWIFKNVTFNYPHPVPHVLSATLADICDGEVLQLQALGNLDLPLEPTSKSPERRRLRSSPPRRNAARSWAAALPEVEALRAFGEALGIAFQMRDDLLDVTADERSLGKPVGNDLVERKTTLPLIAALPRETAAFAASSAAITKVERPTQSLRSSTASSERAACAQPAPRSPATSSSPSRRWSRSIRAQRKKTWHSLPTPF